jgi:putative transposase
MAHRFKVVRGGPYPHFVTLSIVRWLPVFITGEAIGVVLSSLEHVREHRGLLAHAYVVMPTHIHLIVTASHDDLPDIMRDLKKFTSRRIFEHSEASGDRLNTWIFRKAAESEARSRFKVWQDEYHPEVIYTEEFFRQKVDYIHRNPVRKGLVGDAVKWYHSSAAAYEGLEVGPLRVDWLEW